MQLLFILFDLLTMLNLIMRLPTVIGPQLLRILSDHNRVLDNSLVWPGLLFSSGRLSLCSLEESIMLR